MSGAGMNCDIATRGVTSSPDRARVTLYFGITEVGTSFEFTLLKDLTRHVAT